MADDIDEEPIGPEEGEEAGGDGPPAAAAESWPRDKDLLSTQRGRAKLKQKLEELFDAIADGFQKQSKRSDDQQDYWDCYNCETNDNQFYNGNAQIYVPLVRDAVNARATRFSNHLFPPSGKYIEVVTTDGAIPFDLIALLNHYIRAAKLKTQIIKALCRNGDIEGQYNLCVDWQEIARQLVSRETHGPLISMPGLGQVEAPVGADGEEIEDIKEEDIVEGRPSFEVLHDSDVLVTPTTCDTIEEALSSGGAVVIVRRWSKAKIDQMADDGAIRKDEAKRLKETMGKVSANDRSIEKSLAEHVGVREAGKQAVVWEVWTMLKLGAKGYDEDDGAPRLCRLYFGPEKATLGAKRNPYWNDRCPLLSCPVEKVSGVFKGASQVAPVAPMQYEANDAINEGADAAHYAALPIIVRDPEKANGPMVLNLAAIWDAPPDSIKFMEFPDLTARALQRVQAAMQAVFQSLGVNPAMMPQSTGRPGAKRNQAEIALELQVDLLTTNEATEVLAEGILTPSQEWAVDLDYQFRDRALTVRAFGELGLRAELEEVAPLQNRSGFEVSWAGAQQTRNAQQSQQQVAWLNVARGMIGDLKAQGYQLNPVPALEASAQSVFDARTAARTIVDLRKQMTVPAELENELMLEGHDLQVHPMDNDPEHIQKHAQGAQQTMDPHGTIRAHIQRHLASMQLKTAAMVQSGGQPTGAGGPQQPGASRAGGPPRMGAQPAGPRLVKGPPGAIHPDQMSRAGAPGLPRKT